MIRFFDEPDFFNYTTEFKGRVNLGNINITGGTITGITDLAIADGGTGSSTALGAVQNLLNNTALTTVTIDSADYLILQDASDTNAVKRGLVSDIITAATLSDEYIQDLIGAMFTGNTETLITVTYEDTDGTIDLVVNESAINHDSLTGFVANEHIDWTSASANFSTSGSVTVNSINGIDVNPGSDIDVDLITVGVTGTPALSWIESTDRFSFSKDLTVPNSFVTGGLHSVIGNIAVTGTVDGRNVAADGTKLDGIEALADVTDEANVTDALDGATLTAATISATDKVLIQDTDDSNILKTVTTDAIANLFDTAASTTVSGLVELATNAEALTGTDTVRAITPDDLLYARPFNMCSVYLSLNQTLTNNTFTKIEIDTEQVDTLGDFDNLTNYRFTPSIGGIYLCIGMVTYNNDANAQRHSRIYKNGSAVAVTTSDASTASYPTPVTSAIVSMNGSTDYLELYGFQNSGGDSDVRSGTGTALHCALLQRI